MTTGSRPKIEDYLLARDGGYYRFAPTFDVGATVYEDNPAFYAAILADLRQTNDPTRFVYFNGWWSDLRLPLGSPRANPPRLGEVLQALAAGRDVPPVDASGPLQHVDGPQICCMLWQQKTQVDLMAAPTVVWPDSVFGAPILASINTATVKAVNALPGRNRGVLDKRHAFAGSHHQKMVVMLTAAGLVAYVGSSDFNADRLYAHGDRSAPSGPGLGAPLNDVNVRLTGPAAVDVLTTFVDRWAQHPDAKDRVLIGASYSPMTTGPATGAGRAQISHTYAKSYPFPTAVRSAADAQVTICRAARTYLHVEDQYLIGTPELAATLRDRLATQLPLVVVGVMAPLAVVGDLPWLKQRRTDFWLPLVRSYPDRVLLFEMLAPDGTDTGPGAYLHNKMTIADDTVVTFGSVNFSRRSHTHDSEVMVAIGGLTDPSSPYDIARQVRARRWGRHLGVTPDPRMSVSDGIAALRRLGSGARIRRWIPTATGMGPVERFAYERAYDTVLDPA